LAPGAKGGGDPGDIFRKQDPGFERRVLRPQGARDCSGFFPTKKTPIFLLENLARRLGGGQGGGGRRGAPFFKLGGKGCSGAGRGGPSAGDGAGPSVIPGAPVLISHRFIGVGLWAGGTRG